MRRRGDARTYQRGVRLLALAAVLTAGAWLGAVGEPAAAQPSPLQQRAAAVARDSDISLDLEYARPGGVSLKLDLYRPRTFEGTLPLVVFIHGGGWRQGDKAKPLPAVLAGYGYAVASINYRLSGQAPFPAQIQDCKAAVRWLRAHARQYRLDPNRVGVWGNSAGGHLAALVGLTPDRKEWEVGAHLDQSSRVQAVCDFFGPTDLTDIAGGAKGGERTTLVGQLVGGPPAEKQELVRAASPLFHVGRGAPPFFIAHGADDDLVPLRHSRKLHAALQQQGTPVTFLEVQGAGHGFSPESRPPQGQIYLQVLSFFNRHLKGAGS